MAKFPTEVERSVTVKAPLSTVYRYLWDVVGSSTCIPGIDACTSVGQDTYRFLYAERSTGPISMIVQYTARYEGNGTDGITFAGINASGDNTEVSGSIRLAPVGPASTKIAFRQLFSPDTPVPRLLQGFLRSYVEKEASDGLKAYLASVKRALEAA